MLRPFSEIPAVPLALGFLAGILLYGVCPWWVIPVAAAAAVALFVAKRHYLGFILLSLSAGWLDADVQQPTSAPEITDRERHFTAVVTSARHYDSSDRLLVKLIEPRRGIIMALSVTKPDINVDRGDTISFTAKAKPLEAHQLVPHETDFNAYNRSKGATLQAIVTQVDVIGEADNKFNTLHRDWTGWAVNSPLSPEAAALICAMTSGETALLQPEVTEQFRQAGMAHVLAISGFHVGVIVSLVTLAFYPLGITGIFGRRRYWLVIVAVWLYALFVGLPLSACRAAIMASIFMLARLMQSRVSPYNSLAVAALIIMVTDTAAIHSPAFQLSFSAVLGILAFTEALNPFNSRTHYRLHVIAGPLFVAIGAVIGSAVFTLLHFNRLPLLSMPFNVIVTLILPIFIPLGAAAVLLSHWGVVLAPLTWLVDSLAKMIIWLCRAAAGISVGTLDSIWLSPLATVAIVATIILAAIALNLRKRPLWMWSIALAALSALAVTVTRERQESFEAYLVPRGAEVDILVCNEGKAVLAIAPTKNSIESIGRNANRRFAGYLLSRNCTDSLAVIDGDFRLGSARRIGNTVIVGNRTLCFAYGFNPVGDVLRRCDFLVVSHGHRLDPETLLDAIAPDTVILAGDRQSRWVRNWEEKLETSQTPYITLSDNAFRISTNAYGATSE